MSWVGGCQLKESYLTLELPLITRITVDSDTLK